MGGGPPVFPQGSTCLAVLWILPVIENFAYGTFTLCGRLSQSRSARSLSTLRSPKPRKISLPVWALSISLAATLEIDVSFSSSAYLDVSVQRVPFHTLWIGVWMTGVCPAGFPHSEISGSMDICSSPKLFAAYHVFHRLLVPRHPPCALVCLIFLVPFPGTASLACEAALHSQSHGSIEELLLLRCSSSHLFRNVFGILGL